MMKMKRINIPRDFSTVAVFDTLAKLFSAIASILLIRLLEVSVYSNYVKFNSISSLIYGVVGTSMAMAYARGGTEYLSRGYKCKKTIYFICIEILLFSSFIISCFCGVLSRLYSASFMIVYISILYGVLLSINRLNESYFQIDKNFKKAGWIENIKSFVLILLLVVSMFCLLELSEKLVFTFFLISVLVPVIFGMVTMYNKEGGTRDDTLNKNVVKIIFSESGALLFYTFLLNLIDQTDVVMVNKLLDEVALSNYGVALKYYQLLLTLQASLSTVFRIRTSDKIIIDSASKQKEFSVKWIKKTWKFIILSILLANIVATPVMTFLNGNQYNTSISAFRVFILGAGVSYMFAPNAAVMMSAKKYKTLCFFTTVGFVINAVIDIIFIPKFGICAAAAATVFGNAFLNISCFVTIINRE